MNEFWDRIGISASLLCVIHCLFSPVLVLFLPVLGEFVSEQWFHWLIAGVVIPVAAGALWLGYRRHRNQKVLALGAIGIGLLVTGLYISYLETHSSSVRELGHQNPLEIVTMIAAGLTLASAHLLNLRACRVHSPTVDRPPLRRDHSSSPTPSQPERRESGL